MQREVLITLIGTQTDESGEENRIVTKHIGEYFEKNDAIFLLYEEQDADDGSVTKNMLKIAGKILTHTRKGQIEAQMLFEEGTRHEFVYKSPFGQFHMATDTSVFAVMGTDTKKTIRIEYDLSADGSHISHNTLTIKIREQ